MDRAIQHLTRVDPLLGALIERVGPLPERAYGYSDPYEALLFSISQQQIHAKAAAAVLGRLKLACAGGLPSPTLLQNFPDSELRAFGFSAAKILALKDVAAKALDGTVPSYEEAQKLSDDALIARLTRVRGVGRWTVEMLLIFTLKRPDIFPVDDFGVREGYRLLHALPEQPKPKMLVQQGLVYAPYRTLATLYLWHRAGEAKKASPAQRL